MDESDQSPWAEVTRNKDGLLKGEGVFARIN